MAQLSFRCPSRPQQVVSDWHDSKLDRGPSHPRTGWAKLWLYLWRHCFDPYRPELYYMRGPGPRWRKKHERALA